MNNNNNHFNKIKEYATETETGTETKTKNPYDHEAHITTIVGPPALHMINCLKRGQSFSFKDISVEGLPILKVYAEVDPGYWWK